MSADARYPLGAPVNRPQTPVRVELSGRPGWFTDGRGGAPYYVEPVKPAQGAL